MADTLTIKIIDRSDLPDSPTLTNAAWWIGECSLCGSTDLRAHDHHDGGLYDGADVVCWTCGAVDRWSADSEEGQLAMLPDDPDEGPIRVLREVFEAGGRAEWVDRATGVDAKYLWLVEDGDGVGPLLDGVISGPPPDRLAPLLDDLTTRDREVLADVLAELKRAREKWGPQPHPWGLSWYRFDHLRQCAVEMEAEARRTLIGHDPTWAAIIGEEAGEALRESDPARAVAELIQVGAMVLAAMTECPDLQGVERGDT